MKLAMIAEASQFQHSSLVAKALKSIWSQIALDFERTIFVTDKLKNAQTIVFVPKYVRCRVVWFICSEIIVLTSNLQIQVLKVQTKLDCLLKVLACRTFS